MGPANSTIVNHANYPICLITFNNSDILYPSFHSYFSLKPGERIVVDANPDVFGLKIGFIHTLFIENNGKNKDTKTFLLYHRYQVKNESVIHFYGFDNNLIKYSIESQNSEDCVFQASGRVKEEHVELISSVRAILAERDKLSKSGSKPGSTNVNLNNLTKPTHYGASSNKSVSSNNSDNVLKKNSKGASLKSITDNLNEYEKDDGAPNIDLLSSSVHNPFKIKTYSDDDSDAIVAVDMNLGKYNYDEESLLQSNKNNTIIELDDSNYSTLGELDLESDLVAPTFNPFKVASSQASTPLPSTSISMTYESDHRSNNRSRSSSSSSSISNNKFNSSIDNNSSKIDSHKNRNSQNNMENRDSTPVGASNEVTIQDAPQSLFKSQQQEYYSNEAVQLSSSSLSSSAFLITQPSIAMPINSNQPVNPFKSGSLLKQAQSAAQNLQIPMNNIYSSTSRNIQNQETGHSKMPETDLSNETGVSNNAGVHSHNISTNTNSNNHNINGYSNNSNSNSSYPNSASSSFSTRNSRNHSNLSSGSSDTLISKSKEEWERELNELRDKLRREYEEKIENERQMYQSAIILASKGPLTQSMYKLS